ncbi:MAG: transcriptional regulator NrdR [Candidatus Omnitrophica bacterium]|nr:transcriptional regulator NrdR [Candidatus Omnitrophota bacterium]
MKCPFCQKIINKVVDSRVSQNGRAIRRRRECLKCGKRFTTYEYIEETPLMVIKKDGRREAFDRNKLLAGVVKACEKRPISMERLEKLTNYVERAIQKTFQREVRSKAIGELVMKRLYDLDEVAYVRFASVYRQFKDVNQFMKEIKHLLKTVLLFPFGWYIAFQLGLF